MRIGRRHFLKFLGSALVGAQSHATENVFISPTHFVDRKLGFGFKIPNGWHLEAFRKDFNKLLGGQQLSEEHRGDNVLFAELSEGLLAILSKYPLEGDSRLRFSPSVTFFRAESRDLEDYSDLLEMAQSAVTGFSSVLTDYECTEIPEYVHMSGCTMVRSKSKFLFEHEELESTLIDNETFVIHHKNYIYTIHLYDSPHTGDSSQDEFTLFKSCLHIA